MGRGGGVYEFSLRFRELFLQRSLKIQGKQNMSTKVIGVIQAIQNYVKKDEKLSKNDFKAKQIKINSYTSINIGIVANCSDA